MPNRTNMIYRYDGTFPGLLCCVFECFRAKEMPQGIEYVDEPQGTLFGIKEIETRQDLAERVERSIPQKISPEAYELVRDAFLTCLPEKEIKILRFLLLGYRHGAKVTKLSACDDVHALDKAVLHMRHEAHLLTGFIRFSDYSQFLAAVITPKNNVMPVLAPHFCERFSCENFIIFDKVHGVGFLHQKGGRREFFEAEQIELPPPDAEEEKYRELWRRFYQAIAIEGRINPRLRRGLCPMRYWPNMTEFQKDPPSSCKNSCSQCGTSPA